ncbi:hypothetical protein BB560_007266 [Smittium megazygosporum]|uniref:ATP-grasp domain-containing protein n=1 Tax=Smittium megazygosporum TaxID=133381 RepID=A0A2T9XXJ3_9FUNG|nr:hypothetical protein BB560_007266 [Smittium megazygosporum]
MKVLIIGSGGREHALARAISKSAKVTQVFVAPGNGGTEAPKEKIFNLDLGYSKDNFSKLVQFSVENEISLVIPGPEQPLVDGISECFKKVGIPCFGPSQQASRIEGSKAFSKDFMQRHNIPTAAYKTFNDYRSAKDYLESISHRVVIKASGLAAGKGVYIPLNKQEELECLDELMISKVFGESGDEIVIEEYLDGEEVSVLAITDGYTVVQLPPAQDHKRAYDNDQGPNTGGMGAYAPAPIATPKILDDIQKNIIQPTIDGMRRDGFPFVGCLFAGLMITPQGPKVIEYNCRFGDPETEAVLSLLCDSCDFFDVCLAAAESRLDSVSVDFINGYAATVIMASGGYPGSYEKNKHITFEGSVPKDVVVYHAGTSISSDGNLVTSGGRVLAVTGVSDTLQSAIENAYSGVRGIVFDGAFYRNDIGHRALAKASDKTASKSAEKGLTYSDTGVDIEKGNKLVDLIKPIVKSTKRSGTDSEIGGFGGLFDLKATNFKDPILVSATDGVGTKLIIAQKMGIHTSIGIDLVAMQVNDIIVQGAEPLFFLDYYACGGLDVNNAKDFISGVARGCTISNCALIGGETAEMPDVYGKGEYDVAGFAVGAVERDMVLPKLGLIKDGDVVLGLASSGVHSNGFSLVRRIISNAQLDMAKDTCPWKSGNAAGGNDSATPDIEATIGYELLTPTKIYVKSLLSVLRTQGPENIKVKALSHITGGGFIDNIPRVLPEHLGVDIDATSWTLPPLFKWLKELGNVDSYEMARTFNCGIGMILIVDKKYESEVTESLKQSGETVYSIGNVVQRDNSSGSSKVVMKNIEMWG